MSGLVVAGLVLAVTLGVALRLRSLRKALLLLTVLPAILLTAGFLSVTHFPQVSFKIIELRSEWHRLHPTFRVALWVARLGSVDLMLTDASREADEYVDMGMVVPSWSQHFSSPLDGYFHAIDLRVSDASDLRNWARQGVFLALGLKADRHGGTADHPHVSVPMSKIQQTLAAY